MQLQLPATQGRSSSRTTNRAHLIPYESEKSTICGDQVLSIQHVRSGQVVDLQTHFLAAQHW